MIKLMTRKIARLTDFCVSLSVLSLMGAVTFIPKRRFDKLSETITIHSF